MAFVWPSPGERPKKVDGVTFYALAGEDVAIDAHSSALLRAGQLKAYNPFGVSRPTFFDPGGTTATADLSFTVGLKHGASATTSGEVVVGDGDSSSWVWLADSVLAVDGVDVLGYLDVGRWIRQGTAGAGGYTTFVTSQYGVAGNGTTDDRAALDTLCNTTVPAGGGTVTVVPSTVRVGSALTVPLKTALKPQCGSRIVPDAGVTVEVLGELEAGRYQIFDCAAAGSRVKLVGKVIPPEWFGARPDGATNNVSPLLASLDALSNTTRETSGGVLELSWGTYGVSDIVRYYYGTGANRQLSNVTVRGQGRGTVIRHLAPDLTPATNPLSHGIFTIHFLSGSVIAQNWLFEDLTIQGNSTEDYCKILYMGFVLSLTVRNVLIQDNGYEGICTPGAGSTERVTLENVEARRCGVGGGIAAFNPNAWDVFVTNSRTYDCGVGIEHTGRHFQITNNQFIRSTYVAIQAASTTYSNMGGIIANNIVNEAGSGIAVTDQVKSIGRISIYDNHVYNVSGTSFSIGARPDAKGFVEVRNNYAVNGAAGSVCMSVNSGPCLVAGNTVERVHDALTLGTGVAGSWVRTASTTNLGYSLTSVSSTTNLEVGFLLTGSGIPSGTQIAAIVGTTLTLSKAMTATATGVSITFLNNRLDVKSGVAADNGGINGVDVNKRCTLTIDGVVGTYTVLSHSQPFNDSPRSLFLDQALASSCTEAVVTYTTAPWAVIFEDIINDDHEYDGNFLRGKVWTTALLRTRGYKCTIRDTHVTAGYQDLTGLAVVQIVDATHGIQHEIKTGTGIAPLFGFDCTKPWCWSHKEPSFLHADSAPTQMTWKIGDRVTYNTPAAGGNVGLLCTAAGTAGTLNGGATTGAITSGTAALTVNSGKGLVVGDYIAIAGVTGTKRITARTGNAVTIDSNADATVGPTAAISYVAPTWKGFGAIAP